MTTLLEAKGLEKRFGGLKAVDGLSLAIEAGELHCLIGPNGAGKSTFFKLILGRYPPTAGTVHFKGEDITRLVAAQRINRGMSVKMQVPGVFPELPVWQNLTIALQSHFSGAALRREVDRLLAFVDLAPDARKLAGNLSHGQKQWLEIAMAVGVTPTLLLLDEPTAGMSPEETWKTGELILDLNRQGMTVLVVEHDMAFVRQIARQVSVLHFGKLFAQGDIDTITNDEAVQEIYLGKGHHAH
ncbi:MAG TPA: ABC transporter ATP-binding protein [Geminicoccus sp.]|uniref:ABC transporter ATP-binding protein n=1 Tax=Geminicoccus sp. TaxID=2024832 RepID=UPI002CE29F68|nr:ABC transporter ATP-binding protein [Geminicoccus sp.]HWL70687.1 ABC transporter ATP-binding protein [Geminicoccus sp.]